MGLFEHKRNESSITRLPDEWNKDCFHTVNINDNGKSYVGYFWATNNWVEIHCFKKVSIEIVYSRTEYNTCIDGQWVNKLWANLGFVFEKRVFSAIMPRRTVKFSYLLDSNEFYSNKYKFKDTIYINLNKNDISRWKQWHPDDLYKYILPGVKENGWYAICNNNLYKLEWDNYLLIGGAKQTAGSYNDDFTLKVDYKAEKFMSEKHESSDGIMNEYIDWDIVNEILWAHNKYRQEVGVPDLVWDDHLAAGASEWADHLNFNVNELQHSYSNGNYGENLAWLTSGCWTEAIDLMANERYYFKFGVFPEVCNNDEGDWSWVGHYTQIIWRNTQKVGAGKSGDYFVFRYYPAGNYIGQWVY